MKTLMSRACLTLVAFVVVANGAHAQVHNSGVQEQNDEFTGAYSCSQRVSMFASYGGLNPTLEFITAGEGDLRMTIAAWYRVFGSTIADSDVVYFRFGDDVISLKPDSSDWKLEREVVTFDNAHELAARVMSAGEDIRVRYSGRRENLDFTIMRPLAVALAEGFGQSHCWEAASVR